MSDTKTYTTIRLFNHLLVIFQLFLIISLLCLSLLYLDFLRIEEMLHIPGMTFSKLIILIIFNNLIIPFFGACSIDSKLRLYMKIFTLFIILNLILNILVFSYTNFYLIKHFEYEFSRNFVNENGAKMFITETYQCNISTDPSCIEIFSQILKDGIFKFKIIIMVFIIVNSLMGILGKISQNVEIQKKKVRMPKIEKQNVGFSSNSLRRKVVFTPDNLRRHDLDLSHEDF